MTTGHESQIYDPLRRAWVARTPEEEVRQWFTALLIKNYGYPPQLMANEVAIRHNGLSRRCDTVVYDHGAKPLCIVEYKAPTVRISTRTFDQIVRYNMVLGVRCLMVTNGLRTFVCWEDENGYTPLKAIPRYDDL